MRESNHYERIALSARTVTERFRVIRGELEAKTKASARTAKISAGVVGILGIAAGAMDGGPIGMVIAASFVLAAFFFAVLFVMGVWAYYHRRALELDDRACAHETAAAQVELLLGLKETADKAAETNADARKYAKAAAIAATKSAEHLSRLTTRQTKGKASD